MASMSAATLARAASSSRLLECCAAAACTNARRRPWFIAPRCAPANREIFLLLKPPYALSYNDANGTPNWVSWRVTADDLGNAPRKQVFDSDNALPSGFKIVAHRDYSNSGFDRGHLCPHSDRAA